MSQPQLKPVGSFVDGDGVTFRVWAPFATAVGVSGSFNNWSQTENLLLREGDSGYWVGHVTGAKVGQQYKYVIHNGDRTWLRNDPRALQLTAAQDATVIVDNDFNWQDDGFKLAPINERVIYELHIGTFNRTDPATPGTFETAMAKLDYLQKLGINVIEIMPVSGTNMERWWGYEPTYLYAVEASYGGRRAFMEFVDAAHQKGIGVVVDVVYNHLSPEPGLDLWQFDGWSQDNGGGIYFYNDWRGETPWGPRLDYGRPEVRQYITDNVRMWLQDCHVDGLRADAVFAIRNAKGYNNDPEHDIPEGWSLLQDLNEVAHQTNPQAFMIAEDVACNDSITAATNKGGAGFDGQWETTFPNILRAAIKPLDDHDRYLEPLKDAILKGYNGDAFQRVIYSESHDADANGQARLNEEVTPGHADDLFARRRSTLAAVITLTAPGVPMLFQGQEFLESGWFNHWQALDWSKAEQFHGIVQLYTDLITLRRNLNQTTAGLTGNNSEILHFNDGAKVIAYRRWDESAPEKSVVIAANFSNNHQHEYEIKFPSPGSWKTRFNSDWQGYSPDFNNTLTPDTNVDQEMGSVNLAPYSTLILSQD